MQKAQEYGLDGYLPLRQAKIFLQCMPTERVRHTLIVVDAIDSSMSDFYRRDQLLMDDIIMFKSNPYSLMDMLDFIAVKLLPRSYQKNELLRPGEYQFVAFMESEDDNGVKITVPLFKIAGDKWMPQRKLND